MPRARAAQLRPVTLGSSSNLVVGQSVFAIGNPFGLDQTLTSGIVSGLGRELPVSPTGVPIANVIQTDAAINPGNSGGVLLDSKGRLVGINTAIVNPTGIPSFSGVGFAIPIDSAKGLIEQLLKYGRVIRPYLGISLAPSSILRSRGAEGVLVLDVAPNGPAGRAGLRGTNRDLWGRINWGDIITAIDGQRVRNEKDMFAILDSCNVGQTVEVTVVPAEASMGSSGGRDGMGGSSGREGREARMLRVTLAERDAAFKTAGSE
jgi:S1-C subfamily serine protease